MTDHRNQVRSSRRRTFGKIAMAAGAVAVSATLLEFRALASDPPAVHPSVLMLSEFGNLDVSPSNSTDKWHLQLKTNQDTDVAVFRVELDGNSAFGWHSHPGASYVTVTQGPLYEYDSKNCAQTTFQTGDHFYEPANNVHDVRAGPAGGEVVAVQIMPHGANPVIPQPTPKGCQ